MNVRVAKCLVVSKVLVADGMVSDAERAFLDELMKRQGLDESERRTVIELEGLEHAEAALASLPEAERRAIVDELMDAASADGRLSGLEVATVNRITAALGVS